MRTGVPDGYLNILLFSRTVSFHSLLPAPSPLLLARLMPAAIFLRYYSRSLYDYPLVVILVSTLLTGFIPFTLLYFHPVQLTNSAEIGFDTKDTSYSGPRQAWRQLQSYLSTTNRIPFENPGQTNASIPVAQDQLRQNVRQKRAWADDLLSAVQNVPCYDAPIPLMDHLSQFVLELPSYDAMFDMKFLEKLCYLHGNTSVQMKAFDSYTPYRNIWSISNYFSCLSLNALINCTELTQADVTFAKQTIDFCSAYRRQLVDCKVACNEECSSCPGVPSNCSTQMMFDLFYRVLPKQLSSSPFLVNTFLPFFTLTGYSTQNIQIPLYLYTGIENAIVSYSKRENFHLKGILMDVKRERLLAAAMSDSVLALVAAALIMTIIAIHSRSVLYAIAVFTILALSVITSLAVYGQFTKDFPLLNLVIFVLLIAVGTDDAFLLFSSFPEDLNENSFHKCLMHTGSTMFLTSFSTAVPFFVNIMSNVIVFRCFGLFAGVTTIVNWCLVVSFLPAFLILQRRWCKCLPSIPPVGQFMTFSIHQVLPSVLLQGRFVWLSSLSLVVVGMTFVTVNEIRLPEYNPLQIFISSNPHEWYDNNAEKHFEFVANKIALPLYARLVWGVEPSVSTARFKADDVSPLRSDKSFHLGAVSDVKRLALTLRNARNLPFVNHTEEYWPERFLTWSHNYPCLEGFLCCNVSHRLFSTTYLDFCLRNSTSFIFTSYNDTPIFDNTSFALTGYTALLPSNLRYNHRFSLLSHSFSLLSSTSPDGGWWTPEWPLMSTWFDLQRSIISDCRSSVLISIAVVTVLALLQLHLQAIPAVLTCVCIIATSVGLVILLGWVIGVLEAVILVLVVGLSFDYTLHFGAAIPNSGCAFHRVQEAAAVALAPVTLAAITSFSAGSAMLFSQTHAFYQVGTFLVVVTSVSWLFATFFFLPLLTLTLPNAKDCSKCNAPTSIPLHKF